MESGNQPSLFSDLLVTHTMGNHIHDTTKWTRFIAIVFIVCIGLILLLAIVAGSTLIPTMEYAFPAFSSVMGNFLLVLGIIFFLVFGSLAFFLLRFALLTRRGLEIRNQTLFNEGLKSLKIYFIIYGVYSILTLLSNGYSLLSSL